MFCNVKNFVGSKEKGVSLVLSWISGSFIFN